MSIQTQPTEAGKALMALKAIADAIRDAGEIPAGTLYAALMPHGCSLRSFKSIVGVLTDDRHGTPLVIRRGDLLAWNGDAVLSS